MPFAVLAFVDLDPRAVVDRRHIGFSPCASARFNSQNSQNQHFRLQILPFQFTLSMLSPVSLQHLTVACDYTLEYSSKILVGVNPFSFQPKDAIFQFFLQFSSFSSQNSKRFNLKLLAGKACTISHQNGKNLTPWHTKTTKNHTCTLFRRVPPVWDQQGVAVVTVQQCKIGDIPQSVRKMGDIPMIRTLYAPGC